MEIPAAATFAGARERMRLGSRKDVTTKNERITKTMEGGFSNRLGSPKFELV